MNEEELPSPRTIPPIQASGKLDTRVQIIIARKMKEAEGETHTTCESMYERELPDPRTIPPVQAS
eukprot:14090921-Heterocapsa_arctica.AAC.1